MRIALFILHRRGDGESRVRGKSVCEFCSAHVWDFLFWFVRFRVSVVFVETPGVINVNQNKHSLVMFWVTFITPFLTRERLLTKGVSQENSRCPTLLEI